MTFYSEATMQQSLALLERIFQTSRGIHLLFNTACGLPNRDLARPDYNLLGPPVSSQTDSPVPLLFWFCDRLISVPVAHRVYWCGKNGNIGSLDISVLQPRRSYHLWDIGF